MTSKHSLYKNEKKWKEASLHQKIGSKHQRKINRLQLENVSLFIRLNVYKRISERQARFTDILREDYPEEREEIKKKFFEKYGKSPSKKELTFLEVSKIKNKAKGAFLLPRLKKKFNLDENKGCGRYVEEKFEKGFLGYVCGDTYKGIYKLCLECVKRNKQELPKGFNRRKCKCGNEYGFVGIDIGMCIKCLDASEEDAKHNLNEKEVEK